MSNFVVDLPISMDHWQYIIIGPRETWTAQKPKRRKDRIWTKDTDVPPKLKSTPNLLLTKTLDQSNTTNNQPHHQQEEEEEAVSDTENRNLRKMSSGGGPISQDWEPVVLRKKAPTAAARKDDKAVNAARRSGADIETLKKRWPLPFPFSVHSVFQIPNPRITSFSIFSFHVNFVTSFIKKSHFFSVWSLHFRSKRLIL